MSSGRVSLRGDRTIPATVRPGGTTVRTRAGLPKRSIVQSFRGSLDDDEDAGRVRVALRLRPKNSDDILAESDFADCVEVQSELKRVKLRKNNWASEYNRFDEVFTEIASQRRVYEAVAKPVVESVLNGYNGTVMAYGQTGTGKTYTLGQLGKNDPSERGIMLRALEDILADITPFDSVSVSYMQLYMESIQDLLAPEKINIPIVEDPKTGEVTLPGLATVDIRDLDHFLELLQIGEANRHAANTKMNTESSRSHATLMVHVKRSSTLKGENELPAQGNNTNGNISPQHLPVVLKSKLLIVDLAGSERIDKSGSEGHMLEEAKFINLSLTSLGKCINALAENSPHIPTRDSKLTRLLRDSFGGTARTSLIVTIGPSGRHYSETASTIAFGQRAMKVVNTIKLKEEIDYESLYRKVESQVDNLTSEMERQQKLRDDEREQMSKRLAEYETCLAEAENRVEYLRLEVERQQNLRDEEKEDMEKKLQELETCLTKTENEADYLQLEAERQQRLRDDEKEKMEKELKELETCLAETEYQVEYLKLERNELQKHRDDEKSEMETKLNELETSAKSERNFAVKYESLEEENSWLDIKIKKLMEELKIQKGQNDLMCDEILRLEMCLKQDKQQQLENSTYQKVLADTTQMYEKKVSELTKQLEDERSLRENLEKELNTVTWKLTNNERLLEIQQTEIEEIMLKLEEMSKLNEEAARETQSLKVENRKLSSGKELLNKELRQSQEKLLSEEMQRKSLEDEVSKLKKLAANNSIDLEEVKAPAKIDSLNRDPSLFGASVSLSKSNKSRETSPGQKATISKIFEEVGLPNVLALLKSEELDVQIHAVKVVANLAAEDSNQEKIVEEGGLDALLLLLESSEDPTIHRVTAGAIANLAMNGTNQGLIISKGGARLLANIASKTDDPQTLRMIAGAIANLCGNEKLHMMLKEDGGTKALMGMVRSGHGDVIAQIARGIANFAKCESRGISQGHKKGRSLLIDDGVLGWMVSNSTGFSTSTRRHLELALCHLAQNEANAPYVVSNGGVGELVRISRESSREDIRNLAKKALNSNPTLLAEMRRI